MSSEKTYSYLRWWLSPIVLFLYIQGASAAVNAFDNTVMHPAIPLLDESGGHVLNSGNAYSPKTSCGTGSGCHDYEAITHAYHFEMGRDEASDDYGKKRGLPQLVSPGYFGGYSCMGGSRPRILSKKNNASENEFMDQGSAGIIKACTGCHTGGGWMEKDRNGLRYDEKKVSDIRPFDGDYYEWVESDDGGHGGHGGDGSAAAKTLELWDWKKSGVVEADCMMCHADFSAMKKFPASGPELGANDESDGSDSAFDFWKDARRSALVANDFFREAATPMWEFYDINPDVSGGVQLVRFERTFNEGKEGDSRGYTLNLDDKGKPIMHWNPDAFDENKKAHIKMLRFPANENCMMCHRTSNSRRGFYGFGGVAAPDVDDDGLLEEDYQDDVHKGKTWTADNGEVRQIENCNTCHSRNYINPAFANVEMNVDHNFLKGNSDMDVRNDLDYAPNARSCEYCHDESKNPIVPSGQAGMLEAHLELWKLNGDMAGYDKDNLTKITQTHFDVMSCQACHINDKKSRGKPIQIMYRYRKAADGKLKITPYNPKVRFYWRDRNSDRVVARNELSSVYAVKDNEDGSQYAVIVNPVTGEELGEVSFKMGRHGPSYGDPETYDAFVGLKRAYDGLLQQKGYSNADVQMHLVESNEYLMTHNVRPSSSAIPCESCHSRKQSGAFSSLVSAGGILGTGIEKTIAELIDKRVVDEGLVVLDADYMKAKSDGTVVENVGDILYGTKIDSFMTALRNSSAPVSIGEFKSTTLSGALEVMNFNKDQLREDIEKSLGDAQVYLYNNYQGDKMLQRTAVVGFAGGLADVLLPSYRLETSVINSYPGWVAAMLEDFSGGSVASSIHKFSVSDQNRNDVSESFTELFMKLPYRGQANNPSQVRVVYSRDGSSLHHIAPENIRIVQPHNDQSDGYVVFATDKFGYFAVMN